ncbi:TylF/MycF family methyltransferase [Nocardioides sp.]|uniref:TylF/MycF family methyltransferase n=1 Tax=Nocardioides sp. TaxID=35761 RepID=UPI0035663E1A
MVEPSGADLYLNLIAKVLARYGFEGRNATVKLAARSYPDYLWSMLRGALPDRDVRIVEAGEFNAALREDGRDWPADAETMIGMRRLANLRHCVESALDENVPGDFIETGAWRGGATIFMRAILKARGVTDRTVWVADSFEGLPEHDGRYDADLGDLHHTQPDLAISLEEVQENFRRYDLLDDQVRFLVGWFVDTLPTAPIERLAVLRLDGDMYASTMDALNALYDKVSPGGFVIVDDFGAVPACAKAIHEFRDEHGITAPLEPIDWAGVFWRKPS